MNWTKLMDAMRHIRDSGKKWPSISLRTETGLPVDIKLGGSGVIFIMNGEAGMSARITYAVISADGMKMTRAKGIDTVSESDKAALRALCKGLAEDPKAYLAAAGQRLGYCCLCSRPLSNDESVERGMGPSCAERAGWA